MYNRKGTNLGLQSRKYKATVFATRYDPTSDIASVKKDLETDLKNYTGVIHTVDVEKVETRFDFYASYKITCFCENTAVFMKHDIWPEGIFFKWWKSRKNNNNNGFRGS